MHSEKQARNVEQNKNLKKYSLSKRKKIGKIRKSSRSFTVVTALCNSEFNRRVLNAVSSHAASPTPDCS